MTTEQENIIAVVLTKTFLEFEHLQHETIDEEIFGHAVNILMDVLEPVYIKKFIKNYKIECTKENNPNIYDDHVLHIKFGIQFQDDEWVTIDSEVCDKVNLQFNVRYCEPSKIEFIPVTFVSVDKEGNLIKN